MRTHKNLYYQIYKWENIVLAFKKARKGKTKKEYVVEFQKNAIENLQQLQFELMTQTYKTKPLKTFILRDPKTRKISKSEFRDRIIHHALCNVLVPIFEESFIYDSCANRKGKGNLFALKRFDKFIRQCSKNNTKSIYCLKADIKHYFQEINHEVLLKIIRRKIVDGKIIWLIRSVLERERRRNQLPKACLLAI